MFWRRKRPFLRKQRHTTKRLGIEHLEVRRLMAVTTALNSGTLTITGDAAADDIAVVGTANPGEITVTGRNGTTINGTPDGSVTIPGVTGQLLVNLGDGENLLNVDNTYIADQIQITTGAGNDRLILAAASPVSPAQGLVINTGAGNDTVLQDRVYVGGIGNLDTGDGADVVRWIGVSARLALVAHLGDGDNSFFGSGVSAQGIGVRAGTGGNSMALVLSYANGGVSLETVGGFSRFYIDTVFAQGDVHAGTDFHNVTGAEYNVFRCVGFEVDFSGGRGNDSVNIYGNQLMRMDVGSHNGHDAVSLSYNVCPQGIFVITGEGDDTVIATGNFTALPYQAAFDGITGFDRLTLIGNQFPSIFTNNMVIV
jgi:hypothetical protein